MSGGITTKTFFEYDVSSLNLFSFIPFTVNTKACAIEQTMLYVLPALSIGCSACHFHNCGASNNCCSRFVNRTELKECGHICTDESFDLAVWRDQIH